MMDTLRSAIPVIAAVFVSALAATAAGAQEAAKDRYPYCEAFKGQKDHKTVVALLDVTDAHDQADTDRLAAGMNELRQAINSGDQLVVQTVLDAPAASVELFDHCKPGCPPDSYLGALTLCDKSAVARDTARFLSTWRDAVVNKLPKHAESSQHHFGTALAATIAASANRYKPQLMVIFSDFVEFHSGGGNLPDINFYSSNTNMRSYLETLRKRNEIPRMNRATAIIGFGLGKALGRSDGHHLADGDWKRMRQFWEEYFAAADASHVNIGLDYLPGNYQASSSR